MVDLGQMAAVVRKSKRTLERCKTDGTLPAPAVEGGGWRADSFHWPTVRPRLEARFGLKLPEVYPGNGDLPTGG
jgi:hypothetical protein